VQQVLWELLVQQDQQVLQAQLWVPLVRKELLVLLVLKDLLVHKDLLAQLVQQDLPVNKELLAHKVFKDLWGQLDRQVLEVQQVQPDLKVFKDQLVLPVLELLFREHFPMKVNFQKLVCLEMHI
jgi:hypothetical protein